MAPEDRDIGKALLSAADPAPMQTLNPDGASPFLLIGDHAGNRVPASLGTLGVGESELARHIGWDIGVAALGEALAARIDAVFVRQTYSRLVIDCNRAPDAPDAIPVVSDGTDIPANAAMSDSERAARVAEIHTPYQGAIASEIARRDGAGLETILVALHSFTPIMRGFVRPWHCGILHDAGDPAFAHACLAALRRRPDLVVGDNEPYSMDGIDYTVPRHAYPAGRRYVEVEIRQDLLASAADIARWCEIMAAVLGEAAHRTDSA